MRRAVLALLVTAPAVVAATEAGPSAVPPGNVIRVKGVHGDTVLRLHPTEGGGLVPARHLTRLLGGTFDTLGTGRWRVTLYGAAIDLALGAPFAGHNGFPLPLSEPARLVEGEPHVPLQLFSEIIPRFGIGILWDASRWEVRLFQAIARSSTPAGAPAGGAPAAGGGGGVPSGTGTGTTAPSAAASAAATPVRQVAAAGSPPASAAATATPARPAPAGPAAPAPMANGLMRRYTVVVDAGHGGVDPGNPGAVVNGRRYREKEITLAIALRVEAELRRRGVDVLMTRRTDTLIALGDRGVIANEKKADLFVSIHTNAANLNWRNGAAVRGFETYFLSTARTEDEARVAAMENDAVRFENLSVDPRKGDPLSFIIADMAQNEHLRESSELAATMQQGLARVHPGPNRGVKQAGLVVLTTAHMPAVLVEVGFGSNREETAWMASAAGQAAAATAIADATLDYLRQFERRARPGQR